MPNKEQNTDQESVKEGMQWINTEFKEIAARLSVNPKLEWKSEFLPTGEKNYLLVVEGKEKKRSMKLFRKEELESCLSDNLTQNSIRFRLTQILSFLYKFNNKS